MLLRRKFMVPAGAILALWITYRHDGELAVLLSVVIALVSGFAILKPLPSIGLSGRWYAALIFAIIGLGGLITVATNYSIQRKAYLAELRDTDPSAYLDEIETSDPDLWFQELRKFDPVRFAEEEARRAKVRAEQAAAEAAERKAREAHQCSDAYAGQAFIYAQYYVEEQLRSPSSAKFPTIHRDGTSARAIGNCTFDVRAYVDAQNGFGATVRTRYHVRIKRLPERDSWRLVSIDMN